MNNTNDSKDTKTFDVRWRACNCYEIGIRTDTILFALMKMQDKRWEHVNPVEKCEHWEYGTATHNTLKDNL